MTSRQVPDITPSNSGTDTDSLSSTQAAKKNGLPQVNSVSSNEKNGSRNTSDVELASEFHQPMSITRVLSIISMGFLFTGSQIPVYLLGGIPPYIYGDIGGVDRWVWMVLANLLALAAVCPFVGSLSDILGRRYVSLVGSSFLVIGMIVVGTAQTMNVLIGGMAISGIGAGICELTSIAVTAELAPTRLRGKYVAVMVFSIVPFCPSVLYGQLIASHSSWRYCALFAGAWALVGFLGVLFFYFPPPRANSQGLSRREVLQQIDWVGGFLSVGGLITFLAGLQWGGYQYAWKSVHVLVPLIIGAFAIFVAFPVWEIFFAKHPMFPSRMKKEARTFTLTLIITFISGANFFALLMFWPTQAFNVYGHDPIGVGLRGLPIGFAILTGCVTVLWLLSTLRGYNRELLVVSSVLMTAGTGALAVGTPDNMHVMWGLLILSGIGIGGIVAPASVMTTIICPDDLIATVVALTLSIRVVGGCVGYTTYYNVFVSKFVPNAKYFIGGAMVEELHVRNATYIEQAIEYTGASLLPALRTIPAIGNNQTAYEIVVRAGQIAYSKSYSYVYLSSIAFGAVSIVASLFLGNIEKYMDDHIAVVMG